MTNILQIIEEAFSTKIIKNRTSIEGKEFLLRVINDECLCGIKIDFDMSISQPELSDNIYKIMVLSTFGRGTNLGWIGLDKKDNSVMLLFKISEKLKPKRIKDLVSSMIFISKNITSFS
ncbi:MAG: hypothetical protein KAH32_01975 [Chlamydiia bacterium]|nr:hypothetical protein [Chlamydiia bacterium]